MGRGLSAAARRLVLEVVGWVLLLAGVAALVLPGPGLLLVFAGLAVLSQQYAWARRWVEPVRVRALRGAEESVRSVPRVIGSCAAAGCLGALGVVWLVDPDVPSWWPLRDEWWMLGGAWTGITLLASCVAAYVLIGWSWRHFRA